jgi:hypothetical protein
LTQKQSLANETVCTQYIQKIDFQPAADGSVPVAFTLPDGDVIQDNSTPRSVGVVVESVRFMHPLAIPAANGERVYFGQLQLKVHSTLTSELGGSSRKPYGFGSAYLSVDSANKVTGCWGEMSVTQMCRNLGGSYNAANTPACDLPVRTVVQYVNSGGSTTIATNSGTTSSASTDSSPTGPLANASACAAGDWVCQSYLAETGHVPDVAGAMTTNSAYNYYLGQGQSASQAQAQVQQNIHNDVAAANASTPAQQQAALQQYANNAQQLGVMAGALCNGNANCTAAGTIH